MNTKTAIKTFVYGGFVRSERKTLDEWYDTLAGTKKNPPDAERRSSLLVDMQNDHPWLTENDIKTIDRFSDDVLRRTRHAQTWQNGLAAKNWIDEQRTVLRTLFANLYEREKNK